jgi:NADH:ubiquinone oxidoreductase subunit 6 (subunit J)
VLLLIGTLPAPISSAPLVILIYVVLVLMLASALATVILRDTSYAIAAFAATMLLVALLYLTVAPLLLFTVQLLIFTVISAVLLAGLLRTTTRFERTAVGPFSREWIVGGAITAAGLAVLAVVLVATSWPVRVCCSAVEDFGTALTNAYVVGLVAIVILLASAALGAGLLMRTPSPTFPIRGRERQAGKARR